jgi:hypothetical protein
MKANFPFLSYLAQFFLEWEMFHTKVVQKIKTHFLCSITLFKNRVIYEIMWQNVVEPDRLQMAIRRHIRLACGITNTKDTHSFSMATLVTRTRLNIALNVHCLSCYGIRYFLSHLRELASMSPHGTSESSAHNTILFLKSIQYCDHLYA